MFLTQHVLQLTRGNGILDTVLPPLPKLVNNIEIYEPFGNSIIISIRVMTNHDVNIPGVKRNIKKNNNSSKGKHLAGRPS